MGQVFKAFVISYATAQAFNAVGTMTDGHFGEIGLNVKGDTMAEWAWTTDHFANITGHAAVGCASAAASGGDCASGALAAGFGSLAGPILPSDMGSAGKLAAHMVIGGGASMLGGGKFQNGAITAAFGYLYNALEAHYHHWHDQAITEKLNARGMLTLGAYDELKNGPFARSHPIYQDVKDPNNRVHVIDALHRAATDGVKAVSSEFVSRHKITSDNPMTRAQARELLYNVRTSSHPGIQAYQKHLFDYFYGVKGQAQQERWMIMRQAPRSAR